MISLLNLSNNQMPFHLSIECYYHDPDYKVVFYHELFGFKIFETDENVSNYKISGKNKEHYNYFNKRYK